MSIWICSEVSKKSNSPIFIKLVIAVKNLNVIKKEITKEYLKLICNELNETYYNTNVVVKEENGIFIIQQFSKTICEIKKSRYVQ